MALKTPNTITISFKQSELKYLEEFRNKYAVPTAILKDFIINTVKGDSVDTVLAPRVNSDSSRTKDHLGIELMDF